MGKKEVNAQQPNPYIHIDEYLVGKPLRPEIKAGFKVFLKGSHYQTVEAFDEKLEGYFNRKI